MRSTGKKLVIVLLSVASVVVLSRCSLKRHNDKDGVKVSIQIAGVAPGTPKAAPQLVEQLYRPGNGTLFEALVAPSPEPTPPSSLSGFDCLMVNAVGRGIPPQGGYRLEDGKSIDSVIGDLLSGHYCTYPGIISQSFSPTASSEVTLSIPAGNQRIFQVVGVIDPSHGFCGSGAPVTGDGGVEIYPYEVGRAITDVFQEISVSISNSYTSATTNTERRARKVACGSDSNLRSIPDGILWVSADRYFNAPTPPASGPVPTGFGLYNQFPAPTEGAPYFYATYPSPGPTPTPIQFPSSTLNGKPVLAFGDFAGLVSQNSSEIGGGFTQFSVYVVARNDNLTNPNNYIFGFRDGALTYYDPTQTTFRGFLLKADATNFYSCARIHDDSSNSIGQVCASLPHSSIGNSFRIHVVTYNSSTIAYSISGGGGSTSLTVADNIGGTYSTTNDIAIGLLRSTVSPGSEKYFNGQVAEVVVFKRVLDSDENTRVINYLKSKYGLP